jgi:hypothetical protein
MTDYNKWFRREGSSTLFMIVPGLIFLALGTHRFRVRPERFALVDSLGCVVGAFGGFFLLLITDYLLHHARLAFIPWLVSLFVFAALQPHLGVGLGVGLFFMVATQLKS